MQITCPRLVFVPVLLAALAPLLSCGGAEDVSTDSVGTSNGHVILAGHAEVAVDAAGVLEPAPPALEGRIAAMSSAPEASDPVSALVVDYPDDGSVFPPEFLPPTFLWHEPEERADTWLVHIEFAGKDAQGIHVLVPGAPPPKGEIDPEVIGANNGVYEGTEYQRSARSWTPGARLWEEVKRRSSECQATVEVTGWASSAPDKPLSRGAVRLLTSLDPVGAPIFYRDVPLMPGAGEDGVIRPLAARDAPTITWRLREVSRPKSKIILKGMGTCGNCHSFSLDGKRLGMDLDGPTGDKGTYAIKTLSKRTVIEDEDVITWNSFKEKPAGHHTIGFMSRISPDGRTVLSTVNEALFVKNFTSYEFLQVFYPTRGILAWTSGDLGEIRALPGADDPRYVHCNPVWSPDGKTIIFLRATAMNPYPKGRPQPRFANDPNELQIKFDLYRMPFNDGRGGTPVPVVGASNNGMSNSFPKVSTDGKWIVWVKCRNGLLMRPDGRLWIVPIEGGEPREMRCNTKLMNSWHSFSPNGRWMVFSSKSNTPYTQAFLTHIDEEGNDSPAILIPNCTADNRAVNLPEFLNAPYDSLNSIVVPAINHIESYQEGLQLKDDGKYEAAIERYLFAIREDPEYFRARVALGYALLQLKRPEEARPQLEWALSGDPESVFGWKQLAHAYLLTGYAKRAIAIYERLLGKEPKNRGLRKDLGTARKILRDVENMANEVRGSLAASPRNPELLLTLASLSECLEDPRSAVELLRRAIRLDPGNPVTHYRLAWIKATSPTVRFQDGAGAVRLAGRAVDLTDGRDPIALEILAAAYAEARQFERAIEVTDRAVLLAARKSKVHARNLLDRLKLYKTGRPFRTGVRD